ncbi:DUF4394 domain-containing protein [Tautonia plasticadhaerens]|uniref:DUF4394 domain-containing protein n=1 Tax=Tautonia plasticadhaerens TaxID=2527974 RepID=A0A518GUS2_9BACT|nr:DUF4394 domain-containing protein [Tautonia plasticadhaerens]QDV32340.1 hypothetical protein ElP_01680 [Tautonia plasticadhaerens]
MNLRAITPIVAALLGLAAAGPAGGATVYSIGDGGLSLLRYSTDDPGDVSRVGFFGGPLDGLDSIDFRPSTGQLYGYQDLTDSYFTVDLSTAALTLATAPDVGATTNTFFLGMDWNPTIDRLRVVTDSTQNLVYNPETGTANAVTNLFYVPGDPNEAFTPLVIENAYTNSLRSNFGGTTQQYVLDYGLDVLATLDNNTGRLESIGELMLAGSVLDFDEFVGFDIESTAVGVNTARALLTVDGVAGLYTIDLTTAEATFLGALGSGFGPTYGLAVAPIPEPTSLALVAIGTVPLGVMSACRRRRRRRASRPVPTGDDGG